VNWFMLVIGIATFGAAGWAAAHRNWDFATIYFCWAIADILIARRG
jgi:hypothetical protein